MEMRMKAVALAAGLAAFGSPAAVPQEASRASRAILVALALDASGSIGTRDLVRSRDLAVAVLAALPEGSEVALITFDDQARLVLPRTTDRDRIHRELTSIRMRGRRTALHDALFDATRYLRQTGPGPRAMVLFTDGRDEDSALELADGVRLAQESGIPVYTIGVGRVQERPLRRIAKLTGGEYARLRDARAETIATHIAALGAGLPAQAPAAPAAAREPAAAHTSSRAREIWTGVFLLVVAAVTFTLALVRRGDPEAAEETVHEPRRLLPAALSPTVVARLGAATQEYLENTATLSERPVLSVVRGPSAGQVFEIGLLAPTSIGRARANDVALNDLAVSAEHCRIRPEDGHFVLHDLKSRNGTYVNERRVARHVLAPGDVIQIGETQVAFRTDLRRDLAEAVSPETSREGPSTPT
jgi:Mg-chelatase subunit ChlD